jgi:hypothetical protein
MLFLSTFPNTKRYKNKWNIPTDSEKTHTEYINVVFPYLSLFNRFLKPNLNLIPNWLI